MRQRRRRKPSGHDINCQQAVSLVTTYLDGALPGADQERLQAHLDECPHCTEHLKQIEATILVTGEIRAEDLAAAAREDLMDLYRRWRNDPAAH
jgi:anti-sigma factor RsiW